MSNEGKTYQVFVSHAWRYSESYRTVLKWLDEGLQYKNYSVPAHDSVDANNTKKLKEALTNQIKPANIVIVIAGMYENYSDWMIYEVNEAKRMGKIIIGIKPRGNQRIPKNIQDNATELVNWQSKSLIDAIKRY